MKKKINVLSGIFADIAIITGARYPNSGGDTWHREPAHACSHHSASHFTQNLVKLVTYRVYIDFVFPIECLRITFEMEIQKRGI